MLQVYMGILWYLVFIVATTFHEASHALLAKLGGDPTAYEGGQLSIDPLPHMRREPIGMIVLPILALIFYGWPIGYAHAPYDIAWAERYPRRAALMALAGPSANLLLAAVAALCIRMGIHTGFFALPDALQFSHLVAGKGGTLAGTAGLILSVFFSMNLILGVFNLLPFPPLDGSGLLGLFTSRKLAVKYQRFIQQPMYSLAGMMVVWSLFPRIFPTIYSVALRFIYPDLLP